MAQGIVSSLDFSVDPFQALIKCKASVSSGSLLPSALESGVVFSVDGAVCRSNNSAGIGGVLKDANGAVLCVFSKPLHIFSVVQAELEAIYYALLIVRSKRSYDQETIWIKSDSLEAVNVVNKVWDSPWFCKDLVERIELIRTCWSMVHVSHLNREANGDADKLAKDGISRRGAWVAWS